MCVVLRGPARVVGGQNGHSVTTDGQEKPGGHLKKPRAMQFAYCVCADVFMCVAFVCGILAFVCECVCVGVSVCVCVPRQCG